MSKPELDAKKAIEKELHEIEHKLTEISIVLKNAARDTQVTLRRISQANRDLAKLDLTKNVTDENDKHYQAIDRSIDLIGKQLLSVMNEARENTLGIEVAKKHIGDFKRRTSKLLSPELRESEKLSNHIEVKKEIDKLNDFISSLRTNVKDLQGENKNSNVKANQTLTSNYTLFQTQKRSKELLSPEDKQLRTTRSLIKPQDLKLPASAQTERNLRNKLKPQDMKLLDKEHNQRSKRSMIKPQDFKPFDEPNHDAKRPRQ